MRWLRDPFALLLLLQDLLRGSELAGMDLGFPTTQRGAALTSSGNVSGARSCFVDSSNNSPKSFPWAEGKAKRGIPKTPAWHREFGCDPVCGARRAQQSNPETPETGQSRCCRAGTANATWASSWQPKLPWEMGAWLQEHGARQSGKGAGGNCPLPGFAELGTCRGERGRCLQAV